MGWALTIDGMPYALTTAQHAAIVSVSDDWPTGGPILVPGALVEPRGSISVRMRPLDGDVDVSGMTFRVFDPLMSVGPATGYHLITWLGTRKSTSITSTELDTNDLTASSTTAFTVKAGSSFASGPAVVHIDQEALLIASRSSNTLTPNAYGRGWYGSRALAHTRDTRMSYYPAVFKDFPGLTRRRVILWRVDDDDVATPFWRGYCVRAPRLSRDGDSANAVYELQCESAWAIERELPLGVATAITNLRGFHSDAINLQASPPSGPFPFSTRRDVSVTGTDLVGDTFLEAAKISADRLKKVIDDSGYASSYTVGYPGFERGNFKWSVISSGVGALTITAELGASSADASNNDRREFLFITSYDSADPRTATVTAAYSPPPLMLWARSGIEGQVVPVTSTFGFPTSWAVASYTDTPHSVTVQPILRGRLGEASLVVEPASVSASNPPYVTGLVRWDGERTSIFNDFYLEQDVPLLVTAKVVCTHWVAGLRYGVFDTTAVRSAADPRNWDWSATSSVQQATEGLPVTRTWYLDGSQKFGEFVTELCALYGCGVAVRDSKYAIVPYGVALSTDEPAATLTADEITASTYELLPDGVANVVRVEADRFKLVVNDQRSIGRFGPGREITVSLAGVDIAPDPILLAQYALSRVINLWSSPAAIAHVTTGWQYVDSVWPGDYLRVTEFELPRGDGTRGLVDANLFVIGWECDFDNATVTYEGVIFDAGNPAGFAPAARVAELVSPKTVSLMRDYLSASGTGAAETVTDYAGSDADAYVAAGGTRSDAGASKFAVGQKVRLIRRNVTSLETEDHEIASISPASSGDSTLTFVDDVSPTFESYMDDISAGEIIDVIPAPYADATTTQRGYAAVSNNASPPVIGGTTDPAKTFAP